MIFHSAIFFSLMRLCASAPSSKPLAKKDQSFVKRGQCSTYECAYKDSCYTIGERFDTGGDYWYECKRGTRFAVALLKGCVHRETGTFMATGTRFRRGTTIYECSAVRRNGQTVVRLLSVGCLIANGKKEVSIGQRWRVEPDENAYPGYMFVYECAEDRQRRVRERLVGCQYQGVRIKPGCFALVTKREGPEVAIACKRLKDSKELLLRQIDNSDDAVGVRRC